MCLLDFGVCLAEIGWNIKVCHECSGGNTLTNPDGEPITECLPLYLHTCGDGNDIHYYEMGSEIKPPKTPLEQLMLIESFLN